MIDYSFSIEVKYNSDFQKIKEILTTNKIKYELVRPIGRQSTIVIFESNYGEEDLFLDIENAFDVYEKRKELGTGKFDVRIHINKHKSPLSTDSWDRPINSESVDENLYLLIEDKEEMNDVRLRQINSKSIAGVTKIKDSKTKQVGFAIYIFPQPTIFQANLRDGQRLQFLNEGLYQTEEEAFKNLQETMIKIKEDKN